MKNRKTIHRLKRLRRLARGRVSLLKKPKRSVLELWVEQQEALEGIYHGVEGCNDPSHGHPINLTKEKI